MREFLKRAEARATKWVVGLFMPDLARQMQAEGLFEQPAEGAAPEYMVVEDHGADITIFSFSGFDILYAGFARYEFRKVLNEIGCKANLVFIRDPNRMGFHVTPDNQPGGLEFFEAEINRIKEQLGAQHNVAVGSSSGGSAALWFATRCGFDEAVIFGAALTAEGFCKPAHVCATLLNLRQLLREPSGYFEMLVVTLGAWWGRKPLLKRFGRDGLMNPLAAYQNAHPSAPRITYYYGARAFTDAWHARMMAAYDRVRLVPLPTGRHNTPAFLKERGQLAMALQAGMSLAR
ncbi:MAG: hypothetical protein RLZZ303_2811 [Candidatus Hydrogenedentota bacterium]